MSTTTPSKEITTKVVTGIVRFSYANVWEPKAIEDQQEPKYSVALLIDKKDKTTLDKINKIVDTLKQQAKTKYGGKLPVKFKLPLRDGDEEKPEEESYVGKFFLNANSKQQPNIVDAELNKILDKSEFYSGCYGRASINFYIFDKAGNKGIGVGLNHLQKIKDGEPLSSRSSAEDDFSEAVPQDDTNTDNGSFMD